MSDLTVQNYQKNQLTRWQISVKSAPLKPLVTLAKYPKSTSSAIGVFLRLAFKIDIRDCKEKNF